MVIYVIARYFQRFPVSECNFDLIVTQDLFHLPDRPLGGIDPVDHRSGNERFPVILSLTDIKTAGQRCSRKERDDHALFYFIFFLYHMLYLRSHPPNP